MTQIYNNPKIKIKVRVDPYSKKIDPSSKNVIKDQSQQLPVEFVLNRNVDFGEF